VLCVFFVCFGEDICVGGSPLVYHIENNLKQPMVLMRVRLERFDLEKLVVFDLIVL